MRTIMENWARFVENDLRTPEEERWLKGGEETEEAEEEDLGSIGVRWEKECDEILQGQRYSHAMVDFGIEYADGESPYIDLSAALSVIVQKEGLKRPLTRDALEEAIRNAAYELEEYGYGYIDGDRTYSSDTGSYYHIPFKIKPELVPGFHGQGYAENPEMFEKFCALIAEIDDLERDRGLFSNILKKHIR